MKRSSLSSFASDADMSPPFTVLQQSGVADMSPPFTLVQQTEGLEHEEDVPAMLLRATEADNLLLLLDTLDRCRQSRSDEYLTDVIGRSGAVLKASHCGYDSVLVNLLAVGGSSAKLANASLESGETPLYLACAAGHLTTVRRLIDLGASCDPGPVGSRTRAEKLFDALSPHRIACCKGHVSIFNLLETQFTSDWTNEEQSVFSALACTSDSIDMVKKFIRGIDLNRSLHSFSSQGGEPRTLLEIALAARSIDVANFLISSGAELTSAIMTAFPDATSTLLRRYIGRPNHDSRGLQILNRTNQCLVSCEESQYDVCWSELHLYELDASTLMDFYDCDLGTVDISRNHIKELPSTVPWSLTRIRVFNASYNQIACICSPLIGDGVVPESMPLCSHITEINLSRNQLKSVPRILFMMPSLEILNLSHNNLTNLCTVAVSGQLPQSRGESSSEAGNIAKLNTIDSCFLSATDSGASLSLSSVKWNCISLRSLDVSHNDLEELPEALQAAEALERLIASNNHIRKFMPSWTSPLAVLNLSHNWLSSSPIFHASTCENTLLTLTLKGNCLDDVHTSIFQLEFLQELDLSFNRITFLPPAEQWKLSSLVRLDLSHNRLLSALSTNCIASVEFPCCLHAHLVKLNLGFNRLTSLPLSVTRLKALEELDLSWNIGLKDLPQEISNMRSLWRLELDGLRLRNLPPSLCSAPAQSIVEYYGEQYMDAVPSHKLKVMIVGNKGHGKTSLAYAIRKKKPPADLNFGKFEIVPWRIESKGAEPAIDISLWDVPGDNETGTLAQCFMTANALYVVVCNLLTLSSGSTGLDEWLRGIQSSAPNSTVLIVGTHADAFKESERQEAEGRLKTAVYKLCMGQDESGFFYIRSCYPYQSIKYHLSVVICSCTEPQLSKATINAVHNKIRNIALEMKDHSRKRSLLSRKVPRAYLKIEEAIVKEATSRPNEPYLTTHEFQELVLTHSGTVKIDTTLAARYLHEVGRLLHFSNHLHGLDELYFINPPLLYGVLAKILIQTIRPVLSVEEARKIFLADGRITDDTFGKYLELFEKFEIALRMGHAESERLLIPCKLPSKPLVEQDTLNRKLHQSVIRLYRLPYVPVNFWSRCIVRLLSGLNKLSLTIRKSFEIRALDLNVSEGFIVSHKRDVIYWKRGIRFVDVATGCSFTAETLNEHPNEISLAVSSECGDYGALGFLVDQVNAIIDEWYPELLRESGTAYRREVVSIEAVCPGVTRDGACQPCPARKSFTLEECVSALMQNRLSLACPGHPNDLVPLSLLVPDLLMADLPARLKLIPGMVRPDLANPLGSGGQAAVYRGQYGKTSVAFKLSCCFSSSNKLPLPPVTTGASADSGIGSVESIACHHDDLVAELVAKNNLSAIAAVRREASMLLRLQHPCLVRMIGVSLYASGEFVPRLALELAPLGDLRSVLDDALNGTSMKFRKLGPQQPRWKRPPLGRALTYRILCQVANALRYLHASDIVYRDLKSDNVLVWNLNPGFDTSNHRQSHSPEFLNSYVNVKLSDYGLSQYVTLQGTRGNVGTPAYQAPEVTPGLAYNQKVDVFSLGILVYELLSGRRPYIHLSTHVLIREAIQRGDRPSLNEASCRIFVDMHCLTQLLPRLWHASQRLRPSAAEVVGQMHSLSFYGLNHCVPQLSTRLPDQPSFLASPSAVYYYQEKGHEELWLWTDSQKARRLHMFDPDLGMFSTGAEGMHLPGGLLQCMLAVGTYIFLAQSIGSLEILTSLADSSPTICSLNSSPTFLFHHKFNEGYAKYYSPQVSSAFFEGYIDLVYCGLSSGVVCVFQLTLGTAPCWNCVSRIELSSRSRLDGHTKLVDAPDRSDNQAAVTSHSATCMCKVADGDDKDELWVGYGSGLCVIGCFEEQIGGRVVDYVPIRRRRALRLRLSCTTISSVFAYGGVVFALCCSNNTVFQLNAKLRVLEYIITINSEASVGTVLAAPYDLDEPIQSEANEMNKHHDTHIRNVYGSLRTRKRALRRKIQSNKEYEDRGLDTTSIQHISSAAMVNDTLWLGVASGDILVVNVNSEGGPSFRYSYGEIMAILRPPNESLLVNPVLFTSEPLKRVIALYSTVDATNTCRSSKVCVWEAMGSSAVMNLTDWWPHLLGH